MATKIFDLLRSRHNVGSILVLILVSNFILVNPTSEVNETNTDDEAKTNRENDISREMRVIEAIAGRSFVSDIYRNGTFSTGNNLWDNLLNRCVAKPSMSCVQKNVYSYIDEKIAYDGDLNVGDGIIFKKNGVDIHKYTKEANIIYKDGSTAEEKSLDEENEINDEEPGERRKDIDTLTRIWSVGAKGKYLLTITKGEIHNDDEIDYVEVKRGNDRITKKVFQTPLEEITDALYDKGVNFLVTHDLKLKLPELMFHGATLRISPRALTKTGALVHVDIDPSGEHVEGRIFFKKIKEKIKKKLLMAAIGIILVIKLIALKLVFVLPIILGVTTAKKMFLKLLLFIFPALSHIFKLCSWYHQTYHSTKHHHHHHLITHNHKPHHSPYHPPAHGHIVVRPHAAGPPTHSHPHSGPSFEHYPQDWELSGPGLGNEYVASGIHRNAIANFKPDVNDANEINSWGLGMPPGSSMNVGEYANTNMINNAAYPLGSKLSGHPGRPAGPAGPPLRVKKRPPPSDPAQAEKEALIRAAALAAKAPPSPIRDEIIRVSAAKLHESDRVKVESQLVRQQQQILAAQDPETQTAEKFYGQLLDKVDKILLSIGAVDPACKERAVCSLYRDPFKHAPYSNLVSNELSKDSTELLPPGESKNAVRYYVYVQAAREGQEGKDCHTLYPNCNKNFD